jgi:sulfite reductase (NADPH) flavoprotein alpha-component
LTTYNRNNPYLAKIRERFLLSQEGSTKETYHVCLDLLGDKLPFNVGDSIGIYPENSQIVVDEIISIVGKNPLIVDRQGNSIEFKVGLLKKANLTKVNPSLYKTLVSPSDPLSQVENNQQLIEYLGQRDLLDVLREKGCNLPPQLLFSSLLPMMPRFYSIASSPHMFPREIHLTVAALSFQTPYGLKKGVGTHYICEIARPHETSIPIFVQHSNGFSLPDMNTPLIMIGPGTGVAPFRAFLQDRLFLNHPGENWLFFGERNKKTDFYYQDFFETLCLQKKLKLSLAFSRDQEAKLYVQHLLYEEKEAVWEWIEKRKASIYLCGDAQEMARDVEMTLLKIAKEAGHTEESSKHWISSLKKEKRYLKDVY